MVCPALTPAAAWRMRGDLALILIDARASLSERAVEEAEGSRAGSEDEPASNSWDALMPFLRAPGGEEKER